MTMRLIDADALKESLTETLHRCDEWIENAKDGETRTIAESNYTAFLESILRVKDAPTIDAVPATIDGALGYLHKVGWIQEHDRIMTEDVAPVRHGRWEQAPIFYGEDGSPCIADVCTECGAYGDYADFKYCPNCGARMDEEVD